MLHICSPFLGYLNHHYNENNRISCKGRPWSHRGICTRRGWQWLKELTLQQGCWPRWWWPSHLGHIWTRHRVPLLWAGGKDRWNEIHQISIPHGGYKSVTACWIRYVQFDFVVIFRSVCRFAPSQWETALLCNDVCHWLDVSPESALICIKYWTIHGNYTELFCVMSTNTYQCSFNLLANWSSVQWNNCKVNIMYKMALILLQYSHVMVKGYDNKEGYDNHKATDTSSVKIWNLSVSEKTHFS